MLAALRFPVARSRGRRYPEPEHSYRNPFQRDRDRVIHTRAFRRLEAKTQVFAPGASDHFRTRLTHTIEVAQVARTVASLLELDTDLTEALALAHDIGHPPFAHAGEDELRARMGAFGDTFDHNLNALDIVERFETRYARFPGLNLTFEVREGIAKHSSDDVPAEYLPELRAPLEAQLIDLADEVAYNTADLDDARSMGMVDTEDIAAAVPAFAAMVETVDTMFPGATPRERFHEALRMLIDALVSGLIEGTRAACAAADVRSVDDVRACGTRLAAILPDALAANREVKRFLHQRVYGSPSLVEERARTRAMIGELFDAYLTRPDLLPENYRAESGSEPSHRVVCRYIAGMTDSFFLRAHASVFGSR